MLGSHNFKAGLDIRRANNLRVPSDAHRSGELSFIARTAPSDRTAAASASRRSCSATSRQLRRYVSPNTDAREQQWRHGLLRAGHLAPERAS